MSLRPLFVSASVVFAFSVVALSACQQAAWKAGATADDLKRDEQACVAQTPDDDTATKQCLRGKGWTVTNFSASGNGSSVDSDTEPTLQPAPLSQSVRELSKTAADSKSNAADTAQPVSSAATASVPTTKPAAPDPLQRQSIQSWWKAGAQAADFNTEARTCLEQLGSQHTPDYTQHLYTRAMASCLRAHGWYAGHDPVYTPLR